jgi:hypothetical protein
LGVEVSRRPSGLKTLWTQDARKLPYHLLLVGDVLDHLEAHYEVEPTILEREVAQVGPLEANVRRDSRAYGLEHVFGEVDADDAASPRVGQDGRSVGHSASRVEQPAVPCCGGGPEVAADVLGLDELAFHKEASSIKWWVE